MCLSSLTFKDIVYNYQPEPTHDFGATRCKDQKKWKHDFFFSYLIGQENYTELSSGLRMHDHVIMLGKSLSIVSAPETIRLENDNSVKLETDYGRNKEALPQI